MDPRNRDHEAILTEHRNDDQDNEPVEVTSDGKIRRNEPDEAEFEEDLTFEED